MTSRYIEGHKNYYEIMRRHQKSMHTKRMGKAAVYILFIIGLLLLIYFAINKIEGADTIPGGNSINVELKQQNYENEKKSPERRVPLSRFMV